MEEPPPAPPVAPPRPADDSPTADTWDADADDALLTPEDPTEGDEEDTEAQVRFHIPSYVVTVRSEYFSEARALYSVPPCNSTRLTLRYGRLCKFCNRNVQTEVILTVRSRALIISTL